MPLPLSVAIVCKNNQSTIERTLASVAGMAAEILAVDSGSTDGTIPLLERYESKVIRSPWLGYVKTKQLALDSCSQPWVLSLDSDESAEPDLAAAIKAAVERDDPAITGYEVNRKVYYHDKPLNFVWQPEWRMRLVRKGRAVWAGLDPHDRLDLIPTTASSGKLAGILRHDSIPTFSEWLPKATGHARLMASTSFAAGKRSSIANVLFAPPAAMFKQIVLKQAWRDGWPGWLAAGSFAAYVMMKHIALVELTRGGATVPPSNPERTS